MTASLSLADRARALAEWYSSPVGQSLALVLKSYWQPALLYPTHGLFAQIGFLPGLSECLSPHPKVNCLPALPQSVILKLIPQMVKLVTDLPQLPLQTNSVSTLLLTHSLEWFANPLVLLQECQRVLREEGQLVIIGCNPWNIGRLCGLKLPWINTWYSLSYLRHLFQFHQFRLELMQPIVYRPLLNLPAFCQNWLTRLPAELYLLCFRKKLVTLLSTHATLPLVDVVANKTQTLTLGR